ncbi:MAG: ATP-dependent DNA helicase RecG [Phycisphaeraceae bacterium]|nr:ATP-dependent DNA helicase RecG [Phycisphaeraceae bacterium]
MAKPSDAHPARGPARGGISLRTPLEAVPGIGRAMAEKLRALGLTNVGRLIAHLPMRHEKLEAESEIVQLVPDRIGSARGEVANTRLVRRGRSRFEAVIVDGTDRLDAVWFNQPYLGDKIRPGMRVRLQGMCKRYGPGVQMVNPRYEVLPPAGGVGGAGKGVAVGASDPPPRDESLRPVYPASESCGSRVVERAVAKVLLQASALIEDHLDEAFRLARGLPALGEAYRLIHAPGTFDEATRARRRLAYDEFLLLQLGVQMKRAHLRANLRAPALRWSDAIDRRVRARFPFTLTPAQNKVVGEMVADLTRSVPANRLIQGDVGSGKTAVALYAMLLAVASGHQAALMAPTEVVARQHAESISAALAGSSVRVELLTGSVASPERERIHADLAGGAIDLVVGTHALLTSSVAFRSLAVAVIDEQHRFGVHQRAALRSKSSGESAVPHVLVMTATPIPRTLALTLFGDLDISTITGLPPGRSPVRTTVVPLADRRALYERLAPRLAGEDRAFVVVPAIDQGDRPADTGRPNDVVDVRTVLEELAQGPWKGLRIAAIHGRMPAASIARVVDRFRSGDLDAIVATTIVEVGVDIPDASIVIIENADRFGLAQLHQIRGRVGRGSRPSECYLVADPATDEGARRLGVMESTTDGFVLAERDFEIRGPGEVIGTRQSGIAPFKVADLMADRDLLAMARRDAMAWIAASPTLSRPEEKPVRRRLMKAHGHSLGLADVG